MYTRMFSQVQMSVLRPSRTFFNNAWLCGRGANTRYAYVKHTFTHNKQRISATNQILSVFGTNTKEVWGTVCTGLNDIYVHHDMCDVCPLRVIHSLHLYHLYRETTKKFKTVFNIFFEVSH